MTEEGELTDELLLLGADRVIKKVKVMEVSPVLLGQGLNTRTLSVKNQKTELSEEEIKAEQVKVENQKAELREEEIKAEQVEEEFKKNAMVEFERFNRNVTSYCK